jgi:hypothetical protein
MKIVRKDAAPAPGQLESLEDDLEISLESILPQGTNLRIVDIKSRIQRETGIPVQRQILIACNKILEDDQPVFEAGLSSSSTIFLYSPETVPNSPDGLLLSTNTPQLKEEVKEGLIMQQGKEASSKLIP